MVSSEQLCFCYCIKSHYNVLLVVQFLTGNPVDIVVFLRKWDILVEVQSNIFNFKLLAGSAIRCLEHQHKIKYLRNKRRE